MLSVHERLTHGDCPLMREQGTRLAAQLKKQADMGFLTWEATEQKPKMMSMEKLKGKGKSQKK